jgi:SEC-C motif
MTGRNDPCHCGSGKKYKHCHMHEDEGMPRPLRLVQSAAGSGSTAGASRPPGSVKLPDDAVVPTDYWEVDLVPLASSIDSDPTARPTVLFVGAGDYVLHAEMVSHPPPDAGAMAEMLSSAIAAACASTGRRPQVVLVRRPIFQEFLEIFFSEAPHPAAGARVGLSSTLVRVDDALVSLESSMGVPREVASGPFVSRVSTWAAWGLLPEAVGEFFAAAAEYHRAAPWTVLDGDHTMTVKVRRGGIWEASVMGAADEVYGLAMYADEMDLLRMRMPGSALGADTAVSRMRGAILSLGFEERSDIPKPMRDEIRREGWPVDGVRGYPMLLVLNTPGGGLALDQMRDLTAALRAIPGFVAKHLAALRGAAKAKYPLRHSDKASGASVEMRSPW